jgi:hypothetical protein
MALRLLVQCEPDLLRQAFRQFRMGRLKESNYLPPYAGCGHKRYRDLSSSLFRRRAKAADSEPIFDTRAELPFFISNAT